MSEAGLFIQVILILGAVVLFVPAFQRLRLGPVLGYLVAGVIIGPSMLGVVSDVTDVSVLAKLGVIFLLFRVGIELPLERVRVMPPVTFVLGLSQLLVTGAVIGAIVLVVGGGLGAAIVVGGGLALSSTAIVLRLLADRGDLTGRVGRAAFAILVIQDLAVGFLLIVVSSFGQDPQSVATAVSLSLLKAVVALAAILGVGRFLLRPLFWAVVGRRNTEVLTALTLLIVLGTGLLTHQAGLSMELGALLAGMLMAETTYRHQVVAEIEPFRGLLLGLFYMTVGMAIDLDLALQHAGVVVALAVALMVVKAIIVTGLGRLVGMPFARAGQLGLLLCQAGEFAFVLLGAGIAAGVVTDARGQLLMIVVALTMMVTPLLASAASAAAAQLSRFIPRTGETHPDAPAAGSRPSVPGHVVIAGFGRVGAAVGRRLAETGVPFVAVDLDLGRIAAARANGFDVYFGDATRPEVLEAVRVELARAVVITLDDPKLTLQTVATLRYIFPELVIYARAYDDAHAAELRKAGAHIVVPELVATGLELAGSILDGPGSQGQP